MSKKWVGNVCCAISILILTTSGSMATVVQDFEVDLGGWTANTTSSTVSHETTGGNPDKRLRSTNNPNTPALVGALNLGSEWTGDYLTKGVTGVDFDVKFERGIFTDGKLRVRYQSSLFNGWHFVFENSPPVNVWTTYSVMLNPNWTDIEATNAGWVQETSSSSFANTMGDAYSLEIRVSGTSERINLDIDNISLNTSTVPEPITVALVGLGLAGIGFSRRKVA